MFNSGFRIILCLIAMTHLGSAQALPISGEVSFGAYGEFITDANGDLSGYDFATFGGANGPTADPLGYQAQGDILDMVNAVAPATPTLTLSDFDLANAPVIEWVLGQVKAASGAAGDLVFTIISGGKIDGGLANEFGGEGVFSFVCDTDCGLADTLIDTTEDTVGKWSIAGGSNSFSFSTGLNVPAPASVALIGLGLLGLGVVRNRRTAR